MITTAFKIGVVSIFSVLLAGSHASAAQPLTSNKNAKLGIDIGWPQCGSSVPTNQAFGIVNINGGLANDTNACLSDQLRWAAKSLGGTSQDLLQVYVNTANPGGLNTKSWPTDNTDPLGNQTNNPYGTCAHTDSRACAWQYGWNRAVEDILQRFTPAAQSAQIDPTAGKYVWWLDVETSNTWKLTNTTFDHESNTADLEGMTAYFKAQGARVGIYSTAQQWGQIVGTSVTASSNLNGLGNWRPGGASLSTAQTACSAKPLTAGGQVSLTQFVSKSLDYNYSCV
jgi:hypothetical protein